MKTRTSLIITAIALLCTAAIKIGPVLLQRATWDMLEQTRLAPGELVYIVNEDGTVTLRLGDGETTYGRQPVDQSAIRIAAKRTLARGVGYYIEAYGGAVANADGTYTAYDGQGLRVIAQDPRTLLADVTFESVVEGRAGVLPPVANSHNSPVDLIWTDTNIVTIAVSSTATNEYLIFSDFVVSAWVDKSAIDAVWDATQNELLCAEASDTRSPTTLGQMQAWLKNNEGQHWSLHKAIRDVLFDGYRLVLDARRVWHAGHDLDTDTVGLYRNGLFLARTFGAGGTDTNDWCRIAAVNMSTNAPVMTLYVATSATAARAPAVVGKPTMGLSSTWSAIEPLAMSWPATVDVNGLPCYRVDVATAGSSMFYSASVVFSNTAASGIEVKALMIDGHRIFLDPSGVVKWE